MSPRISLVWYQRCYVTNTCGMIPIIGVFPPYNGKIEFDVAEEELIDEFEREYFESQTMEICSQTHD